MLVEHARNVQGIDDAVHEEWGVAGTRVVSLLSCSLVESEIDIDITPGTRLERIYGTKCSRERTHCNFGLAPDFESLATSGGLAISAIDGTGEVRAVERPDHPFFVATLYQPQRTSRPDAPHPVFTAFIDAITR